MLHHFFQGYVDAIYVAIHLRAPPVPPRRDIPFRRADEAASTELRQFVASIGVRLAAWCARLLVSAS